MRAVPRRHRPAVLWTAGLALTGLTIGTFAPAAAAQHRSISPTVRGAATDTAPTGAVFTTEHRTDCLHAVTRGGMAWHTDPIGRPPGVDVSGVLAERRADRVCRDDGRVFVEFVAYGVDDHRPVDYRMVGLDPEEGPEREYRFSLGAFQADPGAEGVIRRVEVRVCVTAGPMLPAFGCGETVVVTPGRVAPGPAPDPAGHTDPADAEAAGPRVAP
ncbi:hypothetical protein [Streptomyces sp. ST2-7A]|uniref:hypothetical protein n=1 Tax=Streptomyces sp. ST2-7A TaxID=2907214 RepID=UPI001F203CA8|nr:hypothetical protein [Streptomyces sp. ST2-7A]MCE7083380.1 hypothetical protein [Streptomyces sp. ST2-7A]